MGFGAILHPLLRVPPGSTKIRGGVHRTPSRYQPGHAMTIINKSFEAERAPCGKIVSGQRHQDRDDECVLTDTRSYCCGCVTTRHEYHDGTFSRREVHHSGKVLVDRMNAEHHA